MKITIIQHRELPGGRIVKPGDLLESPSDGSEETLTAYVNNGIAKTVEGGEMRDEKVKTLSRPSTLNPQQDSSQLSSDVKEVSNEL